MAYTKTTWVNNQAPAINAENLNKIEDGIYNSVRYADAQALTNEQKAQARANIAAAPGGFGFGTLPPVISDPDSLNGTADGIYQFYSADHPIGIDENAGILIHYQGNFREVTSSCRQIFYPGGKWAYHLERAYSETWTEWEYVNPPMYLGREYRTIERYHGKPVYTMAVDCKAGPTARNATATYIGIGETVAAENVISVDAFCGGGYTIPPGSHYPSVGLYATAKPSVGISPKNQITVYVAASEDVSSQHIYAIIKYTKTE